ncbi:glycosyl transferase family protein [Catenovulum sediminis]|uniref:Glycosyl transferase family protein n=1 Tax=Catenovulum sediminis TaxID=1740262 RepID=A0ABV1RCR9_9ALTE
MTTEFKEYIKMIGRGQRAGQTLDQAQAKDAMLQVLDGQVSAEQLGAFLMLLRVREETPEELAGFVEAIRSSINTEFEGLQIDLDLGCYAGKRRHLPWMLLAIMAFAQTGRKIFVHGTAEPESKRLYMRETLEYFGVTPAKNKQQAEDMLQRFGFCYAELEDVHEKLNELIQLRSLFGLRSCANTLARMLNPSNAEFSLHGVHHRHFDVRHVEVAELCNQGNVMCFRGEGGEIEYNPERDVNLHYFIAGQKEHLTFPALLDGWQVKPRALELNQLKAFWLGEVDNEYAEKAVVGTLGIYLAFNELAKAQKTKTEEDKAQIVEHAIQQAQDIWQRRDSKNGLFGQN